MSLLGPDQGGALGVEVAAVISFVSGHLVAVLVEFEDGGGDRVDEVPVVGDEQHRALVCREVPLQPGQGWVVEVVGGLVEQQDVRRGEQQRGQRQPGFLPA